MEFFVGAPPRSGNTYLRSILADSYPLVKTKFDHHHRYAESRLENYTPNDIFIVPVRNPVDTVISRLVWICAEDSTELKTSKIFTELNHLTVYWEIVLSSPDKFFIADFTDFTRNRLVFETKLEAAYPLLVENKVKFQQSEAYIKKTLLENDGTIYNNDKELLLARGHLPREESLHKQTALGLLTSPIYSKRLEYLERLYKEVVDFS